MGSVCCLLSSLFSLLLVVVVLRRLDPMRRLCSLLSALFSLSSVPSSLAAAHFSDRTSHLSLRSLHQAIAKLLLGAASGTPGPPRKGQKFRPRSFDPALVLKTDRLHFCNGLWRPGPSHPAKMQSICPSHGALQICSQSGWRPSTGRPRATSKLQNSFSKKPLNLTTTF